MDNVFEILIYLIIIISFLSSIFKKKKQQPQKRPPVQKPQQEDYYQVERTEVSVPQSQRKEEYDILRELEDFFKVGDESPIKVPLPQEQPEIVVTADEHKRGEIWQEKTKSEHIADDWERKKEEVTKRVSRIDSNIEKQAAMFESSLERKEGVFSALALTVKSKLTHPETLKEYIIFTEILGKPKALRR
jgi:hypothetical protein